MTYNVGVFFQCQNEQLSKGQFKQYIYLFHGKDFVESKT